MDTARGPASSGGTERPTPAVPPAQPGAPPARRTEARERRARPGEPCRNCGDPTAARFCPSCGQRKIEVRVRLRDLITEALDDQFSINARLPRTLGTLLFMPGRLTRHYVAGRMARYLAPFRLYVVSSVIFFLIFSLRAMGVVEGVRFDALGEAQEEAAREADAERAADAPVPADAAADAPGAVTRSPSRPRAQERGWADDVAISTPWPAVNALFEARVRRLSGMTREEAIRALARSVLDRLPIMIFLVLPVFALLLKMLYIRRGRFYVEHFIFSLHFHAFVFTVLIIDLLLQRRFSGWLWLWIFVYLFLAMKHFYAQGIPRTLAKYLIFVNAYMMVLGVAFLATLLVAVLLV